MPIFNERKCLLKKALLKLNGFTYKELIKNKIKDFKMNTIINANKFIFKTEYLNNNNNNFNNYIECSSSYISKKTKQKKRTKIIIILIILPFIILLMTIKYWFIYSYEKQWWL